MEVIEVECCFLDDVLYINATTCKHACMYLYVCIFEWKNREN